MLLYFYVTTRRHVTLLLRDYTEPCYFTSTWLHGAMLLYFYETTRSHVTLLLRDYTAPCYFTSTWLHGAMLLYFYVTTRSHVTLLLRDYTAPCYFTSTWLHGAMSQEVMYTLAAVRTWNFTLTEQGLTFTAFLWENVRESTNISSTKQYLFLVLFRAPTHSPPLFHNHAKSLVQRAFFYLKITNKWYGE
jgi:hypothetical protein